MQRIKSISIPEPCHEEWQQMTPVDSGRHCQSCCKTVIDFTVMSNTDVIAYLASHKNACGRITDTKLAVVNYQLENLNKRQFSWKGMFAAASLSMLFPAVNVRADNGRMPRLSAWKTEIVAADFTKKITLDGKVTTGDNNLPLQGVSLTIKGTSTGTQTEADGSFRLRDLSPKDTLLVSCIGYLPVEMLVSDAVKESVIRLQTQHTQLNEVAVSGYHAKRTTALLGSIATVCGCREPFFKRVWKKVKAVF